MADGLNARGTLLRAEQLLAGGHGVEAERLIGQALTADPDSTEALWLMTHALLEQDRGADAVSFARRAMALSPHELNSSLVLVDALVDAGEQAEAEAVAAAAVTTWPHAWQTHHALSGALIAGRRSQRKDAVRSAIRAQTLAPHLASTHNQVGMAWANAGKNRKATHAYRAALELEPNHSPALNNLAAVYLRRRRMRKANRSLAQALATSPQTPVYRHNLEILITAQIWSAFGVLFVAGRLISSIPPTVSVPTRFVTWLIVMVVLAGLWALRSRSLPSGFRGPAAVVRTAGWLDRTVLAIDALICGALLVRSLSDGRAGADAADAFAVLAVGGWVCVLIGVIRRHSARGARGRG